jgi:DNA-binding transcriptional ArsR family regulator
LIEGILGNRTAEKVLLFLQRFDEGHAKEIADVFGVSLSMVQRQLERFERAGVLASLKKGRTRLFTWNPGYAFREELRALLQRALEILPESDRRAYFTRRRRPRRTGKPG